MYTYTNWSIAPGRQANLAFLAFNVTLLVSLTVPQTKQETQEITTNKYNQLSNYHNTTVTKHEQLIK